MRVSRRFYLPALPHVRSRSILVHSRLCCWGDFVVRFRVRAALAALLSFALLSQVSPVSLVSEAITGRPWFGGIPLAAAGALIPQRVAVTPATPPRRIPVKEPVRVKPSPPPTRIVHPTVLHGVRAHGIHVDGPPMLRPLEVYHAVAAAQRRAMQDVTGPANAQRGRAIPQLPTAGTRPGFSR